MRLPIDIAIKPSTTTHKSADEYIERMTQKLEIMRQIAKENIEENQRRTKAIHDRNARIFSYKPGDKCWLFTPKIAGAKSKKLSDRWIGPYFVIRQTGPSNYVLADCRTKKEIAYPVNVSRIKPFNENRDLFHSYDRQESTNLAHPNVPSQNDPQNQPASSLLDDVPPSQSMSVPSQTVNADEAEADRWLDAKELIGVKTVLGKKFYHVVWADQNQKSSWVEEESVGEGLKRAFYITHTSRGTKRHNYKQLQRM